MLLIVQILGCAFLNCNNRADIMVLDYSNKPLIMGIVNVTPDSFSDGGRWYGLSEAVNRAEDLLQMGIDILDIGGESTRPNAEPVTEQEEIERVIPVIDAIMQKNPTAIISVDTYRSKTAQKALEKGASIVNDISGGLFDPEIISVAAEYHAAFVAMHIQGDPKTMQQSPVYKDVVREVYIHLQERLAVLTEKGIEEVILDPGIGFGKTVEHNMQLLKSIPEFKKLPAPLLIGLSRKSFIGKILDLEVHERDHATSLLEMFSVIHGADIIRTHNGQHARQLKKLIRQLTND